jgi:hypothetical protein
VQLRSHQHVHGEQSEHCRIQPRHPAISVEHPPKIARFVSTCGGALCP